MNSILKYSGKDEKRGERREQDNSKEREGYGVKAMTSLKI